MSEFTGPVTSFQEHLMDCALEVIDEFFDYDTPLNLGVCALVSQLVFDTPKRYEEIADYLEVALPYKSLE